MGVLYLRSNKILRMFGYCTIDVKMDLFTSYDSSLYCCSLWSDYRKASYKKLAVAFNNVHRPHKRLLDLPWRCNASAMYVNYNFPNFNTVIIRNMFGFIQRLSMSQTSIIHVLVRPLEHYWYSWQITIIMSLSMCILF